MSGDEISQRAALQMQRCGPLLCIGLAGAMFLDTSTGSKIDLTFNF